MGDQIGGSPARFLRLPGVNVPPKDLSLYIHRIDARADTGDQRLFLLPEVHVDDQIIKCEFFTVGILSAGLTMIYHPGWEFVHPLAATSSVMRAWPSPQLMQLSHLDGWQDWPVKFLTSTIVGFEAGTFSPASALTLTEETPFQELSGFLFANN